MDTTILRHSVDVPNVYIRNTKWYYQKGVVKLTKGYDCFINDLGIFCLSSWQLLIVSKFRGQKIYHWDHGWYGRESWVKKLVKRIYFGLADGSFIYGDYAIREMKKNGFNGNKLFPIHNSLDYQRQLEIRRNIKKDSIYEKYFGNNYPILIVIGRLNLRKQLALLVDAVSRLKDRGKIYNIVLIGDGEDKNQLEKQVINKGIQNQVWFYGACYDEEKNAKLIFNADMCVVPGDIGLTAIHCMMFGVPVITHNYFPNQGPEFEVIKEGVTGSFFNHNNIVSLSITIDKWFEHHLNDRESVRQNCYNEIDENWTPEYQINVLKKVVYG
ncbi:glycosyltransferase [Parabacteroides distasonis]|nr:glycosyltransferase [Parabacteroides distasonis]